MVAFFTMKADYLLLSLSQHFPLSSFSSGKTCCIWSRPLNPHLLILCRKIDLKLPTKPHHTSSNTFQCVFSISSFY